VERILGLLPGTIEAEQAREQLANRAREARIEAAKAADVARRLEWMQWSLAKYGNGNR
jgi:hypothetical protein